MSELFANHSEGRVELITLQDNEARGKKFRWSACTLLVFISTD